MSSKSPSSKTPPDADPAAAQGAGGSSSVSVPAARESATPGMQASSESTDTLITTSPTLDPAAASSPDAPRTSTEEVQVDLSYRAPPSIAWRTLPLWDEAPEGWVFPAAAFLLGWITSQVTGSTLGTVLAVAVFLASCPRAWIPTVWEVGREGVSCRRFGITMRWRWRSLAAYQLDRRGVLLLHDASPRPWQYLRGIHVPWGPHQDQLLALVTHYMGPPISDDDN